MSAAERPPRIKHKVFTQLKEERAPQTNGTNVTAAYRAQLRQCVTLHMLNIPLGFPGMSLQKVQCRTAGCYLEGIEGAAEDQQAVVAQRRHHGQVGGVADEVDLTDAGVVVDHLAGKMEGNSGWEDVFFSPLQPIINTLRLKEVLISSVLLFKIAFLIEDLTFP